MNDRRRSVAAASAAVLCIIAAFWSWAAWALARNSFGQCIDGPCERHTGDKVYGAAQAAVAGAGLVVCGVAVASGCIYAATAAAGEPFLTARRLALLTFAVWLVVVVLGRVTGAR